MYQVRLVDAIAFVLFLLALLFQNSVALLLCSVADLNVFPVFITKELLILVMVILTFISARKFRIYEIDRIFLLLFAVSVALSIVNFNSFMSFAYSIKYFIVPLLLYFVGRYSFGSIDRKVFSGLFIIVICFFILLSFLYLFLSRKFLVSLDILSVFESKGFDVYGNRFVEGFPVNFYSYYGDYKFMRFIGPFFDPLTTAFFLVPLLFYSGRRQIAKNKLVWRLVHLFLFIFLMLTQTRAILLAYIVVLFFIRTDDVKYKAIPFKSLSFLMSIIVVYVVIDYQYIINNVDPSTWGHLNAYYNFILELKYRSIFDLLFGMGVPADLDIGNESLFLSMVLYNGIFYFLLFNLFVFFAFNSLTTKTQSTLTQIVLSSMMTYYIASVTTEHWFATTSSGFFWILLGMAIGSQQEFGHLCGRLQGKSNMNSHDTYT